MPMKTFDCYFYPRGAISYQRRISLMASNKKEARAKARTITGWLGGRVEVDSR